MTFNPKETFRDTFTYRNSSFAVSRFPFPFPDDNYMYSVNIEPHKKDKQGSVFEYALDVDEHYLSEIEERRIVLQTDPGRYATLPHMMMAQWDTLELIMNSFSTDYPDFFLLKKDADHWTWTNTLLGLNDTFVFGDATTLSCEPLEYITRQTQGDFVVMDQREGDLHADAGMVTGPADWTMAFDVGMSFKEWHGPVPIAHEMGVFDRALKFLMMLRYESPVRRLNWTMTIHPRLDSSPETYNQWGADRTKVTLENAGELVHLRVEVQALFRLPRSNAILFSIRTYLISLNELATNPAWAKRLRRVLHTLHDDIAAYKGLTRYRQTVIDWLAPFDRD